MNFSGLQEKIVLHCEYRQGLTSATTTPPLSPSKFELISLASTSPLTPPNLYEDDDCEASLTIPPSPISISPNSAVNGFRQLSGDWLHQFADLALQTARLVHLLF